MNKQGNKSNPSGGIEWTHIFGPGTGYTANPVRGCQHACRWRMPDGKLAICYAEAVAERFPGKHYARGFGVVSFDPKELAAIRKLKTPAGIFIDSMSDLFAQSVADECLEQVFQTMVDCPQHVFFSLTKNPSRFGEWRYRRGWIPPRNLFLGVSLPPTFMFGKELTGQQQRTWFRKALENLCACDATVRWVSLEPLSWDCSDILHAFRHKLHWAVIGAASDGNRTYQPDPTVLNNTLAALDGLPVFFKGNLRGSMLDVQGLGYRASKHLTTWRQEFPKL
jgi:protein gp37